MRTVIRVCIINIKEKIKSTAEAQTYRRYILLTEREPWLQAQQQLGRSDGIVHVLASVAASPCNRDDCAPLMQSIYGRAYSSNIAKL